MKWPRLGKLLTSEVPHAAVDCNVAALIGKGVAAAAFAIGKHCSEWLERKGRGIARQFHRGLSQSRQLARKNVPVPISGLLRFARCR